MKRMEQNGTYSSDGLRVTTEINEVVAFEYPVSSLMFNAEADLHIKINNEPNKHLIKAGSNLNFTYILIDKITIIEAGVQYFYSAIHV